jgi:hypothetical protein
VIVDIGDFTDAQIKAALCVAIRELGLWRVKHRSPHDFSAVRPMEVHLTLAESPDVEKHAAYSCLFENIREA